MPDMVKVLFQFEDTPEARRTLAAAMEDPAWQDHRERPTLEIGFGMMEHHALFILTQAASQYGARLLVVPQPMVSKPAVPAPAKEKPMAAAAPAKQDSNEPEAKPKETAKPKAAAQSKAAPAKKESK